MNALVVPTVLAGVSASGQDVTVSFGILTWVIIILLVIVVMRRH